MSYNGSGMHYANENQYPPTLQGYWLQQAPWSGSTINIPANAHFPTAPYSLLHHPSGQWHSPSASLTPGPNLQSSGQYSFQL